MRRIFEKFLEVTVVALMLSLAILVVLGVGFRRAGSALVWYDEVASILLAWLTYFGACLAAVKNAHIGFPNLVASLPEKSRRVALLLREGVVIGFLLILAWAGWKLLEALAGTFLISLPWISAQVVQSVIPLSALLFIAAEFFSLPQRLRDQRTEVDCE